MTDDRKPETMNEPEVLLLHAAVTRGLISTLTPDTLTSTPGISCQIQVFLEAPSNRVK